MSKISFDVSPKDLKTVLIILENLKHGMVKNIKVDEKIKKEVPKEVVDEMKEIKKSANTSKYLSPEEFKKRLLKIKD